MTATSGGDRGGPRGGTGDALHGVDRVGQRQHVRQPSQHGRHVSTRHHEAAQQRLWQHQRRHEPDGLEFRGANALANRPIAMPRIASRTATTATPGTAKSGSGDARPPGVGEITTTAVHLQAGDQAERHPCTREQVELASGGIAIRRSSVPRPRSRCVVIAATMNSKNQGEDTDVQVGEPVELQRVVEHVPEQDHHHGGHSQHHHDRPRIVPELGEHAARGRQHQCHVRLA